ncbi:MAG: hypothetical protein IIW31_04165 [Clostridia bacterium]|nr:hypothetical protein [Clostridia bacterium]
MKLAKRLLSLMLALLMVFALVACNDDPVVTDTGSQGGPNNNTTDTSSNNTSSEEVEFDPGPRPYDKTKGKTFYVIQHQAPETPFKYSQDSLMGEKVAERIDEIEAAYGVTFEFVQVAYSDAFATTMQQMEVTGAGGDIVFSDNNAKLRLALGTGGESSLMVDLLTVDHILNFWDMEKWGNITARETMMAGGTFYGVTPALWIDCTPLSFYVMIYNRDMLKTFEAIDPQEAWEKKEWDRDVMLESITSVYDDSTGVKIYGIEFGQVHITRATILSTGCQLANIDKINADGTVEWHNGWDSADVIEALQWLKTSYNDNTKYFNGGKFNTDLGWNSYQAVLDGYAAYALTRPLGLFGNVVVEADFDFGLTTWAGSEANILSGYYENCYSVTIPVFTGMGIENTAFIMWDLFEGMNGIESYNDLIAYYRNTYFTSDQDVEHLLRDGATLMYSYWPNGIDNVINNMTANLMASATVQGLVEKYVHSQDTAIEEHIVPNKVALEKYRSEGFFD